MPRAVDAEQRRAEIAQAVWRVIRRDGLPSASVRNVAREAGLSMGALRYYFASQSELLCFAMALVTERARDRITALTLPRDAIGAAEMLLLEVLPVDADRLAEAQVWTAMAAGALVDVDLASVQRTAYDGVRAVCAEAVRLLVGGGSPDARDIAIEVDRLAALVDGLALHGVMQPATVDPARIAAVLRVHLDELSRR